VPELDVRSRRMRLKATIPGVLAIVIACIWVWMHFAQSSAILFFGGSFAEITIGYGTVQGHLAIGGVSSLSDWDTLAGSTPYSQLQPSDCFFAPEPRELVAQESADPSSDFNLRPPLADTLFGVESSFSSDRSPGLSQFILTFPFFYVPIFWAAIVVILFLHRGRKPRTEHDSGLKGLQP